MIVLAVLYTLRVIGGAVLLSVPLSRWLLGFAVFLFCSLGLLKRVTELQGVGAERGGESQHARGLPGRGYRLEDRTVLTWGDRLKGSCDRIPASTARRSHWVMVSSETCPLSLELVNSGSDRSVLLIEPWPAGRD